jgi:hypothetical protein
MVAVQGPDAARPLYIHTYVIVRVVVVYLFFPPLVLQANSGLGRLHETFLFTSVTRSRTAGRTTWGDELVARSLYLYTNTEKRTHNTNTKHPCPEWDSNPRSRRPGERRHFMPWLAIYLITHLEIGVDIEVGIATGYWLDDRGIGVRVPVGRRIFFSARCPDWSWDPPNLLSSGYRWLLSRY